MIENFADDRLLRIGEVVAMVALGKSSIYRMIAVGTFPAPLRIAPNASRWRYSEVRAWMDGLQPTRPAALRR